jgi:hypothetical protein
MIIDTLAQFADSQVVTGGSTTVATSDIDTSTLSRNLGTGKPLFVVISIEAVSGGDGSDTFVFTLVDDSVLPIDGSSVAKAATATITGVANIPAGTILVIPVPPNMAFQRYLGLRYAVTADAVLTVTAHLTSEAPPDRAVYPDATEGVTV